MTRSLIVLTVLIVVLAGGIAVALSPLGSDRFADVPEGHYADEAIGWAVDEGITSGCGDDEFCPDEGVTRAQVMTFLFRARTSTPPTTTTTVPIDRDWPTTEIVDCYMTKAGHAIIVWELTATTPIKRATVAFDLLDGERIASYTIDYMNWGNGFSGTLQFDQRWWADGIESWDDCKVAVQTVAWAD